MSHITKHGQRVNDINKFCDVAEEQGHKFTLTTEVRMFGSQRVEAVAQVELKGWRYAIAIDKDGSVYYDHFGSKPNSMRYLGELYQEYNVRRTETIIPFDQVESYHMEDLPNGDRKMVLEYAD